MNLLLTWSMVSGCVAGLLPFGEGALAAIPLTGQHRLLMMLPLCLSIAVVYKTTRCENVKDIPLSAALLWLTILGSLIGLGALLWLIYTVMS